MYGIGKSYSYLELEPFEFPKTISLLDDRWFKNEREFLEFLIRNHWMQRRLGFNIPSSNGLFPDVHGIIFDKEQTKIRVEVEYRAENYGLHGHPFGKADLVLSFIRRPHKKIIRGCPIWSFYIQKGNGLLEYCLDKDINFDFLNYNTDKEDSSPKEEYEEIKSFCEPFKLAVTAKTEIKRKRVKKMIIEDKSKPKGYIEVNPFSKRNLKVGDWYYSNKKHRLLKLKNESEARRVNAERRKESEILHVKNIIPHNYCI